MLAMAKRPTKQRNSSWAVYHIRGTPAQFVGIVYDQPDDQAAIKKAIEEFGVRGRRDLYYSARVCWLQCCRNHDLIA
jgi:hypothetical protein